MEEITIMNINRLRYICLCLWTVWLLPSCTDHDASVVSNEETGLLRFSVSSINANSRISYDNVHSVFEDNDAIGCIITVNGEYAANSKWHYNASTGMLIFDGIWINNNNTFSFVDYSDNDLLVRANTGDEGNTDGFLTLKKEGTYNFYFYYPYITCEMIRDDVSTTLGSYDDSQIFYRNLQLPNVAMNSSLTFQNQWGSDTQLTDNNILDYANASYPVGEARATGSEADWQNPATYAWTNYPCFVNHTQTSKQQINNSDFLWVKQEGLNQSANQSINLTFLKKTATIEIDSDIQLSNVYLQANADQSLRRGKSINLQTGKLEDYPYSTSWDASIQQENVYFIETEQLLPYDNLSNAGTNFRVIFPAQDAFPCSLHFTLNDVPREVDLSTNISSLKEGFLYIIHINQAGETTLEIVDWENEHFEILHPEDAQSPQS